MKPSRSARAYASKSCRTTARTAASSEDDWAAATPRAGGGERSETIKVASKTLRMCLKTSAVHRSVRNRRRARRRTFAPLISRSNGSVRVVVGDRDLSAVRVLEEEEPPCVGTPVRARANLDAVGFGLEARADRRPQNLGRGAPFALLLGG